MALASATGRETGTLDEDAVTGRTEESTGTALADWDATVISFRHGSGDGRPDIIVEGSKKVHGTAGIPSPGGISNALWVDGHVSTLTYAALQAIRDDKNRMGGAAILKRGYQNDY